MLSLTASLADPGLHGRFTETLDRRLEPRNDAPVGLALSGGGDSMALLELAAGWSRARGRKLLCLTVDHRLQAHGGRWTAFAGAAARRRGADWRGLVWEGEKPRTGLPAAARAARHALIADAARDAGAKVVLFAHTRDDALEADAMRAQGTAIGRLAEWSPSPAWPAGRGMMLLRPLLEVGRADLRDFLVERAAEWIEDPANADPACARARVRAAAAPVFSASIGPRNDERTAELFAESAIDEAGVIAVPRAALTAPGATAFVSMALLCASGAVRPPRGDRLARLVERLHGHEPLVATLCGARIEAEERSVRFMRDPGETSRGGLSPVGLEPGRICVWDGRFEIAADEALQVRALKGLAAKLSREDRDRIARFSPVARAAFPALVGNLTLSPALASSGTKVRCLVGARLRFACGVIAHERDIADPSRGAERTAYLC